MFKNYLSEKQAGMNQLEVIIKKIREDIARLEREERIRKQQMALQSKEFPKLKTEYYESDDYEDLMEEYGVKEIPMAIFLDDEGDEIQRATGIKDKKDLIKIIEENLVK